MEEYDISSSKWTVIDVEQAIKALASPVQRPPQLSLRLKTAMRSGNLILRTTPLEIGYPGTPLFGADPIELYRGECAALIGPNGAGKTTFLRTLMGEQAPLDGKLHFGASLKVGYFAQYQSMLNDENSVLDELLTHKHMMLGDARSYLAQFLFRGDDVYKQVSALSGGERARLALAILALSNANFLLLDEPTNHLDIPAQEVLQSVLENFAGTILLVSHDRYLIDRLATQIWELREGKLNVFAGTYAEQVAQLEAQKSGAQESKARVNNANGRVDRKAERIRQNAARKRAQMLSNLEDKIHELEAAIAQLEQDMETASLASDVDKLHKLSTRYNRAQSDLEKTMDSWAELAEQVSEEN